jgi:hypothetical protein
VRCDPASSLHHASIALSARAAPAPPLVPAPSPASYSSSHLRSPPHWLEPMALAPFAHSPAHSWPKALFFWFHCSLISVRGGAVQPRLPKCLFPRVAFRRRGMLPSRSAAQASSELSWLSSAIEVLPKRLFFGSFRFLPPESASVHLFCIDDSLVYEPFYAVSLIDVIAASFPHACPGFRSAQSRLLVRCPALPRC